jgi:hypothetical protein
MNPIEQHTARLQKNVNNTGKNLRNAANAIRNIMTITLRETRGRRTVHSRAEKQRMQRYLIAKKQHNKAKELYKAFKRHVSNK